MATMCGRYVSPEEAAIERFWHIGRHNNNPFRARFNVTPTSIVPILRLDPSTGEIELVNARWGLIPSWWTDPKPPRISHNARSEEAATKPMWKGPLSRSRCLIPAAGWYEWKQVERTDPATGEIVRAKQPHFFHLPGDQLFAFAGVMAMWKPTNDDKWQTSCAVLTRQAIGPAAEVHDRMPVVLSKEAEAAWLDSKMNDPAQALEAALDHAVTTVRHHRVNSRVNVAAADDNRLIEEEPES
jgi:putative SOS response-associated peptidase YedK